MTEIKNKQQYVNQYNRDNYRTISIRFDIKHEDQIIRAITESGSPKAYIKSLILKDLRSKGVPMISSEMKAHDDIVLYPYEVIEIMKHGAHYIVGYCKTMDQARDMLINYVQRQKHGCGAMRIIQRHAGEIGGRPVIYGSQPDINK